MIDQKQLNALKARADRAMQARRAVPRSSLRPRPNHNDGPGTVLKEQLKLHNVQGCTGCLETAKKMDRWGNDETERRRHEIAAEILPRARRWMRQTKFRKALGLIGAAVGLEDAALTIIILQLIDAALAESRRRQQRRALDVLQVISEGVRQWREEQTGFNAILQAAGLTAATHNIPTDSGELLALLEDFLPKVCLIRAMPFPPAVLKPIVESRPGTQFVVVCHSLPSHLVVFNGVLNKLTNFLALSRELPNLWLATPDERLPWKTLTPRGLWLPNSAGPVPPGHDRPPVGPVNLSLIGRRDTVKNFPNQIMAAGIANQRRPCRLHLMINGPAEDLAHLARTCGLQTFVHNWRPHAEHRERVAQLVDVGLQSTFSESFNYVALEHLLAGKPVVGSATVRYLPPAMQADPNDLEAIAGKILHLAARLDDHPQETRQKCRAIGSSVAARNNAALVRAVQKLRCVSPQQPPALPVRSRPAA